MRHTRAASAARHKTGRSVGTWRAACAFSNLCLAAVFRNSIRAAQLYHFLGGCVCFPGTSASARAPIIARILPPCVSERVYARVELRPSNKNAQSLCVMPTFGSSLPASNIYIIYVLGALSSANNACCRCVMVSLKRREIQRGSSFNELLFG